MTAMPAMSDFQAAMQNPHITLVDAELKAGSVDTDPMGMPKVVSGGFALTYSMKTPRGRFAVRCFHRHVPDLAARYAAIQPEVASRPGTFVRVEYQQQGVRVGSGVYPVLKMPWVDGAQLGTWVRRGATSTALERLERNLHDVHGELEAAGISHGDLQHGNVLVDPAGSVKLIDYDGMFVPALRGRLASEAGHVNYQHPLRSDQYDATLDRFPVMALTVALRAIRADPALWARYDNDDNMLFTRRDLVDPAGSQLFRDLARMPTVAPLAERLARIAAAPFASIPTVEQFLSGAFTVVARAATATRPVVRSQYPLVDGADREAVLALQGSVVTLIGRIESYRIGTTRNGQPFAFLNFGDFRLGCPTVVLWAEALGGNGGLVRSLKDQLVSVTGLVSVYQGFSPARPQIVLDSVTAIQRLDPSDAAALLASGAASQAPVAASVRTSGHIGTPAIDPVAARRWSEPLGPAPSSAPPASQTRPTSPPPSAAAPSGVNTPRAKRPAPSSPAPAVHPLPLTASSLARPSAPTPTPTSPAPTPRPSTRTSSRSGGGTRVAVVAVIVIALVVAAVWFWAQQA